MSRIETLFPTPVLTTEFPREFTEDELDFFKNPPEGTFAWLNNIRSKNSYLLDDPRMASVKEICLGAIQEYLDTVIIPQEDVKPFLTQSWLNYTPKGGSHHKHWHAQSFLSGVLYIDTINTDSIILYRPVKEKIQLWPHTVTEYNYNFNRVQTKKGSIVVFPSTMLHEVAPIDHDIRISLAFNSFLRGTVGSKSQLTELKL
jgi:hypothetical protein